MSRYRTCKLSIMLLLAVIILPARSFGTVTAEVGFYQNRFLVVPAGQLIDLESLETGGELSLDAIEEFFYIQIIADPVDRPKRVYIHITGELGGERMINFVSYPFTLSDWFSVHGNGQYSNLEIAELSEGSDWFYTNLHQTYYSTTDELLDLIEGGFLVTSTFTISFQVYESRTNTLLSTFNNTVQVYNPTPPELQNPAHFEQGLELPVEFSWDWSGGATLPSDWTLVVAEGPAGSDGETVMETRTSLNTRYEGQPTTTTMHLYTGMAGEEEPLTEGQWYYWQVFADVPSIVPGGEEEYASEIFAFQMEGGQAEDWAITLSSPMDGSTVEDAPVGFSWNWNGDDISAENWWIKLVEGSEESDDALAAIEGAGPGNTLVNTSPVVVGSYMYNETGNTALRSGIWYYWQVGMMDPETQTEYVSDAASFYFNRQEDNGPGNEPSPDNEPGGGGDQNAQQVAALLQSILTSGQYESVMEQLSGFSPGTIRIDDQAGYSISDLSNLVRQEGFEVITVLVAGDE